MSPCRTFPLMVREPRATKWRSSAGLWSNKFAADSERCTRPGSDVVSMRAAVFTCGGGKEEGGLAP